MTLKGVTLAEKLRLAHEAGVTLPHYTNTENPVDFPKSKNKMNERILELLKQAEEETNAEYQDESRRKRRLYNEILLPKFSELIVRECIDICNQHPSKIFKKEWDADVVAWDITQRIKGRFGVEL